MLAVSLSPRGTLVSKETYGERRQQFVLRLRWVFLLSTGGITHQEAAYCMYRRCGVIPAALEHLTTGLKVVLISKLSQTLRDNILQMPFASISRLVFE